MSVSRNFHEDLSGHEEIQKGSERGFGYVMAIAFAVVALWPWVFGDGGIADIRIWASVIAIGFLIVALAVPKALSPLNTAWLKLGLLMAKIVNPLVLGIMFYLAVTPFGLVMRLFGKDLLRLRHDPAAKTYWISREPPGPAPDTMKNQF